MAYPPNMQQIVQHNADFFLGGILTARGPANVYYDLLG
jgi:hypothetical protein